MTTVLEPTRLSCPPRFATPRDLTRDTLGGDVAEMARMIGGRPRLWQEYPGQLMPWQQLVADVAFEMDEEGRFVYGEVVIVVPRQSGKTILVMAKTLMRLISMVASHGEQRSTYVAQKRLDARKKFERDFRPLLRRSEVFREVDHARQTPSGTYGWKLSLNNGSEAFEFGTGSWWQVGVPDDSGGHGDTLDDATIDEARFQETAEVEEGLSPSQITRDDAQVWVVSTPGTDGSDGTVKSLYLWRKVLAGRKACESGQHGGVAYFEWSAPDEANTPEQWGDPEVWRACMPALGLTVEEKRIQAEWDRALREGPEKIDAFRRSFLGQWPKIPVIPDPAKEEHVLGRVPWLACVDPTSVAQDPMRLALDVSVDRGHASFAVAAPSQNGGTHLEVVDYRPGTEWILERATSKPTPGPLLIAAKSPASTFTEELRAAGVEVQEVTVEEHAEACANLFDAVQAGRVRHHADPTLDGAVRAAEKRFYGNESFLWSRRSSSGDICPLVAVTLAAWGVGQSDGSVYEERGMVTL